MTILAEIPPVIEVTCWFVVFHEKSATRWLGLITPGRFKHVSAFGYLPGIARWLLCDVHLGGIRLWVMDQPAVMEWSRDCAVVKVTPSGQRMGLSCRLGFTCVTAVKHLLRLRCVAATPDALYRHILRNGGILISEPGPAPLASPAAARPDAGAGAAAGAE